MQMRLSEAQMQAVSHRDGPMLTLAGPGSGKTTVITRRIAYLIRHAHIDPSNILVITFTKAAAKEMKERFLLQMPSEGSRVTFGTFHAVFFMILKHAYHYDASSIIREEERMQFMRGKIRSMRLECEDEAALALDLLAEFGRIKSGRIPLAHYYPVCCGREAFEQLFQSYHQFLTSHRKLDFDDMLVYTYELFSERSDILLAWQKKYRYILVDEFQDVNQIQYDIVRMLADREKNLFVVGDDDQSIYRFRGAKPGIMLHMPKDYPQAKIVRLSHNYRCPEEVVRMAANIIAHNEERFEKEILSVRKEAHAVTMELCATQREETQKIIDRILSREASYAQTAVLFRTNLQAGMFTERLMEYNIPFRSGDVMPGPYEHWIARDLCAYLRIAQGSRSRSDFLMIMNRPKRYISRESLEASVVSFDRWQAFYADCPWMEERIETLREDALALRGMRPFAAINYIRKAVGYEEFLQTYAKEKNIDAEGLLEILDALQEGSRPFASFAEWLDHIRDYKEEMKRARSQMEKEADAVTLSTFHSAKGLEFDVVHIPDVNEGIIPYKKAVLPADLEEERRMFYVGITRAAKKLHLYAAKEIRHQNVALSRFWMEAGTI